MPMRAPEFWHEPPGLAAGLLAPVGAAWGLTARSRLGCQAVISGDVVCELPMYTRNYVQEGGGIQLGKSDKKAKAQEVMP